MVVIAIMGAMAFLTMTYGVNMWRSYRFQEVAQSFANAATAVRVRAIGGMASYYVRKIEKQGTGTTFRVYLSDFTYVCPRDRDNSSRPAEFPIKANSASELPYAASGDYGEDYVMLTGFNSPSNVNENLFRVTKANYGVGPTQVTATTDQWQVTSAWIELECRYRDPIGSSDYYLTWDTTITSPQPPAGTACPPTDVNGWCPGYELGRLRVVPCMKFVPYSLKQGLNVKAREAGDYTVKKEYAGNSVQCVYDRSEFDIRIKALPRGTTSTTLIDPPGGYTFSCASPPPSTITVPPSVPFDFAGNTRDHLKYFVVIRKLKRDETGIDDEAQLKLQDNKRPPAVFVVEPSGRVRIGQLAEEKFQ
jgi:hypothetical protein